MFEGTFPSILSILEAIITWKRFQVQESENVAVLESIESIQQWAAYKDKKRKMKDALGLKLDKIVLSQGLCQFRTTLTISENKIVKFRFI